MARTLAQLVVVLALLLAGSLALVAAPGEAHADLVAKVHLGKQRMEVFVDGERRHVWRVSTGKQGWATRPGVYQPFALTPHYYSKKWKMSLPYLVSIGQDGTAIHGTTYAGKLGAPASHGCIRLSIPNAATFYRLVQSHGMWGTTVIVTR